MSSEYQSQQNPKEQNTSTNTEADAVNDPDAIFSNAATSVQSAGLQPEEAHLQLFFHFELKGEVIPADAVLIRQAFRDRPIKNVGFIFWTQFENRLYRANIEHGTLNTEFQYNEDAVKANFPSFLKQRISGELNRRYSPFYFEMDKLTYGSLDIVLTMVNGAKFLKDSGITLEVFIAFLKLFAPIALVQSLALSEEAANLIEADVDYMGELSRQPSQKETVHEQVRDKKGRFFSTLGKIDQAVLLARVSWIIPIALAFLIWNSYRIELHDAKTLYINKYDSTYKLQYDFMKMQNETIINLLNASKPSKDTAKRKE